MCPQSRPGRQATTTDWLPPFGPEWNECAVMTEEPRLKDEANEPCPPAATYCEPGRLMDGALLRKTSANLPSAPENGCYSEITR